MKPGRTGDHGPVRCRDDRGRPLPHFDFEAIRASAAEIAELRAYLDDESSHPSRDLGTLWIGLANFAVFACINMAVFWLLFGVLGWPFFQRGTVLVAIIGVIGASLAASAINSPVNRVVRNAIARRRAALISRMAVRHRVCGGCGYPLGSLQAESDGCVVCPECGAAWRMLTTQVT